MEMDAASRYQTLHNEEDSSEPSTSEQQPSTSGLAQADVPPPESQSQPQSQSQAVEDAASASGSGIQAEADASPPPYASINLGATASASEAGFVADYPVPPPYSVATSLPTYDEAEKAKAAALAASAVDVIPRDVCDDLPPRNQLRVGSDGIFILTFFIAFLFNFIGFCLSFCLTNTIAGRYGAICGIGLSFIKWLLLVRFSDYYFTRNFNDHSWLWWIFLLFGFMVFFRGCVNYLKVRNMSENMATSYRTSFLFLC